MITDLNEMIVVIATNAIYDGNRRPSINIGDQVWIDDSKRVDRNGVYLARLPESTSIGEFVRAQHHEDDGVTLSFEDGRLPIFFAIGQRSLLQIQGRAIMSGRFLG